MQDALSQARLRDLSPAGWRRVAKRVVEEVRDDRLTIVAGGVAFYAFLALFPALGALISIWGLFADPAMVNRELSALTATLPESARALLHQAAARIAASAPSELGLGAAASLLLTGWSANKGMKGLIEGICIAYDRSATAHGFVALNGISLALTAGGILLGLIALGLIVALPVALQMLGVSARAQALVAVGRWPILALSVSVALAVAYRVAPPRRSPRWRWVVPGTIAATLLWLAASAAFSYYTASFGSFNETYGSVTAVAVLLIWFSISAFIVLLGAEINAETETEAARAAPP